MKKMKWGTCVFILVGLFVMSSCEKEGCTDPLANNYNKKATKDDGSCEYDQVTNNQEKGNHSYSLISTNGDTLLLGDVPYADGLANTETDEAGNYTMEFLMVDGESPGMITGGSIRLGQNNQPETNIIDQTNNEVNAIGIQTVGLGGVMYSTLEGTVSFENLQLREQLQGGGGSERRATLTVKFDGIFVGLNEEQIPAVLTMTFSN